MPPRRNRLPQQEPEATEPDASDAAADATIQGTGQVDDLQAKIELLQAQVEALQEALEGVKTQQAKAVPSWKGAPEYADKEAGFTFKPRGRLQYDAGYVCQSGRRSQWQPAHPQSRLQLARPPHPSRRRRHHSGRLRLQVRDGLCERLTSGSATPSSPMRRRASRYSFTIGNHETLNGLEQITSSRFTSFMERAAFDDAFVNTRRIGVSAGYVNAAGDLRINAGLFTGHSIDSTFDNDSWIAAARATYSPLMGANQLHFGANFQHREFQSNNNGTTASSSGQASTNQTARYRARPFTQTTDIRFVDTGNFAAKSDDIFGLEFGGIFKSLHVAAEGQYLKSNAYGEGDTLNFSENNLNRFPGDTVTAARSGRQPELLGRLSRSWLFPDRRNARLQEWHVGSHQGPQAVQQGRLGRGPDQWPRRLSRSRHRQAEGSVQQQLPDRHVCSVDELHARRQAARPARQRGLDPRRLDALLPPVQPRVRDGRPAGRRSLGPVELGSGRRRLRLRRRLHRHPCADRLLTVRLSAPLPGTKARPPRPDVRRGGLSFA